MIKKKLLFIFGTRPEAIKLAPVIYKVKEEDVFDVKVCVTAQHREMLAQVLDFFEIVPDYNLDIMKPDQSLFDIAVNGLKGLKEIFDKERPDIVIVQGDTTTTFVGALAGYYKKVKIAHVEAGLRSFDLYSPFPEEGNRSLTSRLTDYHFAPTEKAVENLENEGLKKNVWSVGNTVIDALFLGLEKIKNKGEEPYYQFFNQLDFSKRIILVTCHRRENFGKPLLEIIDSIKTLITSYQDIQVVIPVHLNPKIRDVMHNGLGDLDRVYLIEPLSYPHLIWLMSKSYMVLTDSGGIQEEAPSLGKPVLVLRKVTERMEGIEAGTAKLVGTKKQEIINAAKIILEDQKEYQKMARSINPYGDGTASEKIMNILVEKV